MTILQYESTWARHTSFDNVKELSTRNVGKLWRELGTADSRQHVLHPTARDSLLSVFDFIYKLQDLLKSDLHKLWKENII